VKKLTLSVDARVVARAKSFAHKRGTSVSRMVEQYLDAISAPAAAMESDLPPVTKRLLGALRGVRLDRADYTAYLEQKHR
jgi:Family of unknown function (DUF6364)